MSNFKDAKDAANQEVAKIHKIRITLTSRKVGPLEKVCSEIKARAGSKNVPVKGPVRMPVMIALPNPTAVTPNGEGSNTWDLFAMTIFKRVIDLTAPTDVVKAIIINIEDWRGG